MIIVAEGDLTEEEEDRVIADDASNNGLESRCDMSIS